LILILNRPARRRRWFEEADGVQLRIAKKFLRRAMKLVGSTAQTRIYRRPAGPPVPLTLNQKRPLDCASFEDVSSTNEG